MAVYEYIGDGRPDGAIFVQSGKKGAFFGATPIVQPVGAGQAAVATTAVTTAATQTTPYGFATSTQADDLTAVVAANRTLVNQLRADLVSLGLIKGAA